MLSVIDKIDFDIVGADNTFVKVKLEEEEIHRPWGFGEDIVSPPAALQHAV